MKKLYDVLKVGGVVLYVNEGIAPDYSEPWDMIIGYLPMRLQGIPAGIQKEMVKRAADTAGLKVEDRTALLSTGTHDINILRK